MLDVQIDTWMRDRWVEGKDPVVIARVDPEHYTEIEVTVKLKDEPDTVGLGWTLEAALRNALGRRG